MRVFLGNAPWQKGDRYGVRAGSRWPHWQGEGSIYLPFPFYLAYATAILEKDGVTCKLVDAIAEHISEKEFIQRVVDFNPDVIVLETSTPTIDLDITYAKKLKKACPKDIKVLFSGPHVSVMQEKFLQETPIVDYVLVGEYDYTLRELIQTLDANKPVDAVEGIIYRKADGTVVANPRRPAIANLDELPWPAFHHLPMHKYNDDFTVLPKPMVQMWASRGCPFKCNFCLWPQVVYANHQYRTRDPIKVVDEMEYLINTYGFKAVYFDDDTFDLGKKRIMELSSEIKRRGIKVPWAAMARADTLDKEMMEAMASSGLIAIKYGVESGVQEIVDGCDKHLDLKKVREAVKFTKEAGVKVHLTFTFGLEGETKETIQKTIDFVREVDPDSVQFSIVTPFPGTKYYDELKEQGFLFTKKWSDFDGNRSSVIRTKNLTTEDLIWALNYAYSSWYEHRDRKMANIPSEVRPNQFLEAYQPSKEKENVLVVNYSNVGMVSRTAAILRERSDIGNITLLSHNGVGEKPGIPLQYNEVVPIPKVTGVQKLKTAWQLLQTIRKSKYDLVVFLSDNANSYMRRLPLSLTYFSGAKNKIVTDALGRGYKVEKPFSYIPKMVSSWWSEK